MTDLLVAYFKKFGEKPCCGSDLKLYLPGHEANEVDRFLEETLKLIDFDESNMVPRTVRPIVLSEPFTNQAVIFLARGFHQVHPCLPPVAWVTKDASLSTGDRFAATGNRTRVLCGIALKHATLPLLSETFKHALLTLFRFYAGPRYLSSRVLACHESSSRKTSRTRGLSGGQMRLGQLPDPRVPKL